MGRKDGPDELTIASGYDIIPLALSRYRDRGLRQGETDATHAPFPARIYADRAARRDSDYRHPRCDLVPGFRAGAGEGASGGVYVEREADRHGDDDVCPGL